MDVHAAAHPVFVMISSDDHSILMMPVEEGTGFGIVDPEVMSNVVVLVQSTVVQLFKVRKSYPDSVLKALNERTTEDAPGGAIIADISSKLA